MVLSLSAFAEPGPVEAHLTSAKLVESRPGQIVTASVLVANQSDRDEEFVDQVDLPAGWSLISPPNIPFTVPAHAELVRLLAITVPGDAPSGQSNIRYSARSFTTRVTTGPVDFNVSILSVTKVELTVDDSPNLVIAGESYEAHLRVVNHGNSAKDVTVQTRGTLDFPVDVSPATLHLGPGEAQVIRVAVKTDEKLPKRSHCTTTVKIFDAAGVNSLASSTIIVDVIPKINGNTDPYIRLPAQLKVIAVDDNSQGGGFGMQTELSGAGAIDESGKRRVDFLFRGPDLKNNSSVYDTRDEYRVSYYDDPFDFQLGDQNYVLSPLTERYGYGRGAGFNIHQDGNGFGGYHMQSRWNEDYTENAAYVFHDFNDHFELKGNFLEKDGTSSFLTNAVPAEIYSLQSKIKYTHVSLDLEYGLSDSSHGLDSGWRTEVHGDLFNDKVTYSLEKTYAGPNFYGYYSDSDSTYGTLTFPIYKKLHGTFSFNQYDNNTDLDASRSSIANRETAYRPGLSYSFHGYDLTLQYQDIRRRDALLPAIYDYQEHSARLGIGHDFGKFSLQTFIEAGTLEDFLTHESHALGRYSFYGYYRATSKLTLSAFATLGTSDSAGTTQSGQTMGGAIQWKPRNNLSVDVRYARNQFDVGTGHQEDSVYSTVSYTFPNRHNVSVTGRWTKDNSGNRNDLGVYFAYTIPLSLPVGKKTSTGILRGNVFALEGGIQKPLPRVVVTMDKLTAVTDEKGEFVFPSQPPGTRLIRVQQNSIGLDHVTTEPLPMAVEIKKGGETHVDIGVVKACSLTARLAVCGSAGGGLTLLTNASTSSATATNIGNLQAPTGLEGGLVELSDGKETIRLTTDRHGEVLFDQLRPGKYQMKVYENEIPAGHFVETPQTEIELKAGESQEVTVRILPQHRSIRLIDQGTVK